ncbi:hypothetical protein [Maribacter flavus]|uniref:Uncharacterized protein n=1 Tax=Maribacter flavus TaxID=1658664 RepID=A0A5B2TQF5_9FLAO|nr:hypothetical protein [Maribacter flavus]KAA2215780.1 hypothetical protein F0361_16425 [Maribacter flavus]
MNTNREHSNLHLHLPRLLRHFGGACLKQEDSYALYRFQGSHVILIHTEEGYRYYEVQSPEKKLEAFDLVVSYMAKMETNPRIPLWDKVFEFYNKLSKDSDLVLTEKYEPAFKTVKKDFNHFHTYLSRPTALEHPLYTSVAGDSVFENRFGQGPDKRILFPLYNIQNEVCGYFEDDLEDIHPYGESAMEHGLWYSQIPEKIEALFVFSNPKEAMAFHQRFQLKNAVYLALGSINHTTTRILFQIHRLTKVKKIMLSFTGDSKIAGFVRDLHFISFMEEDFRLRVADGAIQIQCRQKDPKAFARFYTHCRDYNEGLRKHFLKHRSILDQHLVNAYSLVLSQDGEQINLRVPLEINALQLMIWSYYKNFLHTTLDILKPKKVDWNLEWEEIPPLQNEGKEVQVEEYRIAQ